MLYYHVGNKDELYLAVLEGAYDKIRSEERGLDLEHLDPPEAIRRLIEFTWNYFLRNPEFLSLLQTENLVRAKHLKRSAKVKSMHSPFVEMIRTVVRRGVESGDFLVAVDPVQLYISIAALSFFYLSNSATLSVIFGRDLLDKKAKDERRAHGRPRARGTDRAVGGAAGDRQGAEIAQRGGTDGLALAASPLRLTRYPSHRRPGEGRDPYRVIYRWCAALTRNDHPSPNASLWLWVPAFAGTTSRFWRDHCPHSDAGFPGTPAQNVTGNPLDSIYPTG